MTFDRPVLALDSAAKSANIESLFMRSVVDSQVLSGAGTLRAPGTVAANPVLTPPEERHVFFRRDGDRGGLFVPFVVKRAFSRRDYCTDDSVLIRPSDPSARDRRIASPYFRGGLRHDLRP